MAKPILKQFAGLWTLTEQPNAAGEWSLEQKFAEAKKQGFAAVGGGSMPEAPELCAKYGLDYVCYIDANMESHLEKLKAAAAVKPKRVNVQMCDHHTPPEEAVKVWIKMQAPAEKLGLAIDLEIHRDTCTETPEKTWKIAELFEKETGRKIRLCFDHSHIAVVKHLCPPYAPRLIEHPELIQLARQMHFRPFNGHHCQIPVTDGKGQLTAPAKAYLEFIDALLACWLKGNQEGATLYVCPELGPLASTYSLSCFPNVWQDAVVLKKEIDRLWQKNLGSYK